MRCSSMAHSSMVAWGCSAWICFTSWLSFFSTPPGLVGRLSHGEDANTRLLSMEAAQILPAQLGMDVATGLFGDPDGYLGS